MNSNWGHIAIIHSSLVYQCGEEHQCQCPRLRCPRTLHSTAGTRAPYKQQMKLCPQTRQTARLPPSLPLLLWLLLLLLLLLLMLLVAGVVVVLQVLTSGAGVAAAVMWTLRTGTRHQTPVLLPSGEQTTTRGGGLHEGIDAAQSFHSFLLISIIVISFLSVEKRI